MDRADVGWDRPGLAGDAWVGPACAWALCAGGICGGEETTSLAGVAAAGCGAPRRGPPGPVGPFDPIPPVAARGAPADSGEPIAWAVACSTSSSSDMRAEIGRA